jgi:hypothetical protein
MRYLSHAVLIFQTRGAIPRGGQHPGPWVGTQRAAALSGQEWMTPHRQALLDEHLPGWRAPASQSPQRVWAESAIELKLHVLETGRLPKQNGETADERRLGAWLTAQRGKHHRGELKPARTAWLTANVPLWNGQGPRDPKWQQTASEFGAWKAKVHRWPNRRSSDVDERRLATWAKNRREDHRAGRLSAERVELLNRLAPGWQTQATTTKAPGVRSNP